MNGLKPCPFCGAEMVSRYFFDRDEDGAPKKFLFYGHDESDCFLDIYDILPPLAEGYPEIPNAVTFKEWNTRAEKEPAPSADGTSSKK